MKPGKLAFWESRGRYSSLRSVCVSIIGEVVHRQLTHAEFLALRDSAFFASAAFTRATQTARGEALRFMEGAIETLYTTGAIRWKHMGLDGRWSEASYDERLHGRPPTSNHVWADSNKPWGSP